MQRLIINTVFARAVSAFLNFLIVLLIARHAGPAVKGEVTLLITTIWFFIFFSDVFGGQVLVYLIPRNKVELLVIPAYVWSVIVTALGFIFLKITGIHANHVPAIAVLSLLSAVINIHQTILLGRRRVIHSNLVQVVSLLCQVTGILFCFYFLRINDAYAYIYASLGAYIVTGALSFLMVQQYISFSDFLKYFSLKDLKTPFRHGIQYQLVEILQLLNLRYYYYQLGLQQGIKYLGIYSIGISVLETVWIVSRSISTVHYVSTSHSSEIRNEAERTIQLVKTGFLLSALALLILWAVPSGAYTLVFGAGFKDVKHAVRFLFPGILIYSIPIVIGSFYLGIGKYGRLIISNLAGAATLIVFSWLLIPKYVMSGAGLAASISFSVAAFVLLLYFMLDYKIPVSHFAITKEEISGYMKQTQALLKRALKKG